MCYPDFKTLEWRDGTLFKNKTIRALIVYAFLGDPECFAVISVTFSWYQNGYHVLYSNGHLPELGARQFTVLRTSCLGK